MPDREELLRQGEAVGRAIRERMAGRICLGDSCTTGTLRLALTGRS